MPDNDINQSLNANTFNRLQQGLNEVDNYLSADNQPDGFKAHVINTHSWQPRGVITTGYIQPLGPLALDPGSKLVQVPPDTPLFCHHCHDIDAPQYRLRRKAGKYVALCYKPETGDGCWERDATPMCKFEDHQGVQCTNVAEFSVAYGADMLVKTYRCLIHVAPALIDVSEHRIFPL